MIKRTLSDYAQYIFKKYPIITVTGPRQSGKTTLARQTLPNKPYTNLENPVLRQFAIEDPVGFLNQYPQGAVLDEIQRAPELFSYLQVIVDDKKENSTAREWVTFLQASYIVYLLPPFYRNIKKRLVKSQKLYFYDAGLACWLCGIENITHIKNHPLRGHLYENMVVIEALKYRYNLGKRDNLNFFRDSSANEIDLIYNISHNLLPIEIKSGQTITSDYFKGLKKFKKISPDLPYGQLIIYAGDTSQNRTDVKIITVNRFSKLLESVDP